MRLKPTLLVITAAALTAAALAPDGFSSGHRRVTLGPVVTVGRTQVHIAGSAQPGHAILSERLTTSGGLPVSGAMITAFSADKRRRITVYTAADGADCLELPCAGAIRLRARAPLFDDAVQELQLAAGDALSFIHDADVGRVGRFSISNALSSRLCAML